MKERLQAEWARFFIEKNVNSQWICRRCRCCLGNGLCFLRKDKNPTKGQRQQRLQTNLLNLYFHRRNSDSVDDLYSSVCKCIH